MEEVIVKPMMKFSILLGARCSSNGLVRDAPATFIGMFISMHHKLSLRLRSDRLVPSLRLRPTFAGDLPVEQCLLPAVAFLMNDALSILESPGVVDARRE